MTVKVVTDSTADLPPQLAREMGVSVVPVYLRFGEEVYRDGVDITGDEFYRKLVESPVHPSTSQPTPEDFAGVYRELSQETDEIVSIHVPQKVSGACNSALKGKEMAAAKSRIEVIDSLSVSMGLGLIVLAAARVAQTGAGLTEVAAEVKQAISRTHIFGVFDTLKYLVRGGRIGKVKALLGSVLSVKPLITMRDGELVPAGLARTRSKGIERLVDFAAKALSIEELAVVYSTTLDEAGSLKERIAAVYDRERIHLVRLGSALGVHSGPGTLVLALRGKISGAGELAKRGIPLPSLHIPKHIPRLKFAGI
ncbi:DegV family protein [Chloroflexota bacterium]